jgi:hypothetical protein
MLLRMLDLWVPKAGKTTSITSADSPIKSTQYGLPQHPAVLATEKNASPVFIRLYEHTLDQD